jgi:PAS domain S-box-containing protein
MQYKNGLFSLMKNKSGELTSYLNSLEADMKFLSAAPQTKKALLDFKEAWNELGGNQKDLLQKLYITDNPNPTGSKHLLDYAEDGSRYSAVHKKNHPWLRSFLVQRDYYDIFLFDLNGDLVYTVFKELDYATNLQTGEWKDSDLGNAFRAALEKPSGEVSFFDFKPYKPSFDVPASFISTRIDDENGNAVGVLVFQMPVAKLNAIFSNTEGLGETGEISLYGSDFKMRNNSRFSKDGETTILKREWKVDHIEESLAGESDYQFGTNYEGVESVLAHMPFDWKGTKFALVTSVNLDEFSKPLEELESEVIINTSIALSICAILGWLVAKGISKNLTSLSRSVQQIAQGENVVVPLQDSRDELGDISRSLVSINELGKYLKSVEAALDRSQAVIEFNMDGTIITANKNFLNTMGYSLEEIQGKHHSMFASKEYAASDEYKQFWAKLNNGDAFVGEYGRLGKGGKEVWIRASYNPIEGVDGKPNKVIKYAQDVSDEVRARIEGEKGADEAMRVLSEVSQGNLSLKMEYDYKGNYRDIKNAVNRTIDQLNSSLGETKDIIVGLAQGDLTKNIEGEYQGIFYDIKSSVNETIERLKQTANDIKSASTSVAASAGEISSASADLSRRTESQASTLEETAASMEEITGTVRTNSKNAQDANLFAQDAKQVAEEGGEVVKKVVGAMEKISASSTKISDIISVIDEIAFQTNLLALNAAVEAARAGDAGKGFAVVAEEVRALAGRSASASKEIKELISQSVNQVKDGSGLVDKAGQTLQKVVDSFNKLANLISEITVASEEQSSAINEINSAVSQMDAATQENAAMVEESTASAQTLSELAGNLNDLVGFFKVDEDDAVVKSSQKKIANSAPKNAPKIATKTKASKPVQSAAADLTQGWEEF